MKRPRSRYVYVLCGVALLVAALFAGSVVAGQVQGINDPADVASAMQDAAVVRVADVQAAPGLSARGVFMQLTATGLMCVFEAPSDTSQDRRGGCNASDDPLGGSKLSASLSYDGGPAAAQVTDARLIGLVSQDVTSVAVLMSDGTRRAVPMQRTIAVASPAGRFRAFGFRFSKADLRRGLGPTAVLALDARGNEIDRQTTGFGA